MKYKFFRGDMTAEPLKNVSDEWFKSRDIRNEKLKNIINTIPFYNGWSGSETFINGIVCFEDNPALEQVKQDKGYKIKLFDNVLPSEKKKYVIRADKRYKSGKILDKKLTEFYSILKEHPDFSTFALRKLKMSCWVIYAGQLHMAVCGVFNETFIAQIPIKGELCSGDEFPVIPEFLTEIKESEFLAIQGQ
ncbi:hypothetical protein AAUPMG_11731 [Pasteurella multocida subsp. multocida str. Anand1_goat]|nr:hypothetical protein AAUPMG_11731 [Pasteurella multocida subsp. multocida str. Anand1_goat]